MDGWRGLLLLAVAGAQVVFPTDEAGTRACRPGEACIPKDACPEYRNKLLARRGATAAADTEGRKVLVEQLRAMVCNKAEKRVCCPSPALPCATRPASNGCPDNG